MLCTLSTCFHQGAVAVTTSSLLGSVVCEIGPAKRVPPSDLPFVPTHAGVVQVFVEGDRNGTSQVVFTYRVGANALRPALK